MGTYLPIADSGLFAVGRQDGGFYRLSQWELLTGWVGGFEPWPAPGGGLIGARQEFEAEVLAALCRPPCVVAFSGGRDSTAILCVATHLARREGLPEPIAATHDFSGLGAADETSWQELVIRRLGLRQWERVRDPGAFDVLGCRAREGLARFGLLWPALVHCHAPLVELAGYGGSLVVGEGGDEVMGEHRLTVFNYLVKTKRRPNRSEALSMARSLAPRSLRQSWRRRQMEEADLHPWLPRELQQRFLRQDAQDATAIPLRWDLGVVRHLARRSVTTANNNIAAVLGSSGVSLQTPFLGARFVTAWAAEGGRRGFVSRTGMMRRLFGDVVPDEICRRTDKARFGAAAVGEESRSFLAGWHGEGVDSSLVDVELFKGACLRERPPFAVQMLLQAAWLGTRSPVATAHRV